MRRRRCLLVKLSRKAGARGSGLGGTGAGAMGCANSRHGKHPLLVVPCTCAAQPAWGVQPLCDTWPFLRKGAPTTHHPPGADGCRAAPGGRSCRSAGPAQLRATALERQADIEGRRCRQAREAVRPSALPPGSPCPAAAAELHAGAGKHAARWRHSMSGSFGMPLAATTTARQPSPSPPAAHPPPTHPPAPPPGPPHPAAGSPGRRRRHTRRHRSYCRRRLQRAHPGSGRERHDRCSGAGKGSTAGCPQASSSNRWLLRLNTNKEHPVCADAWRLPAPGTHRVLARTCGQRQGRRAATGPLPSWAMPRVWCSCCATPPAPCSRARGVGTQQHACGRSAGRAGERKNHWPDGIVPSRQPEGGSEMLWRVRPTQKANRSIRKSLQQQQHTTCTSEWRVSSSVQARG